MGSGDNALPRFHSYQTKIPVPGVGCFPLIYWSRGSHRHPFQTIQAVGFPQELDDKILLLISLHTDVETMLILTWKLLPYFLFFIVL